MIYFVRRTPMNPRHRIIFLIVFAVPVINLIIFGFIYHIPYALPEAGLLALILGAIFIRLLKARRAPEAPRRRKFSVAVKLYLGFVLVAGITFIEEGWHWYDLLFLVFPTLFSVILLRSNRESLKKESAESNG